MVYCGLIMNTSEYTPQVIDLSFLASKQGKSKAESLANLREEMLCNSKLRDKAGIENLVFGNGNPNADIFFVYEAPSVEEERLRFVMSGQTGEFFFSLLEKIGVSRNKVYVAPIMKYCVKNGEILRQPTIAEMSECLPILKQQIEIIKPTIIVALGSVAFAGLLGSSVNSAVENQRGKIFKFCNRDLIMSYNIR